MKLRIMIIGFGLLAIALLWAGCATGRGGYESAAYTVETSEAPMELRTYPPLSLATTSVAGDYMENNGNNAFGRLFGYISGENKAETKIAMTTPVFMERTTSGDSEMSFVVPADIAAAGTPYPTRDSVRTETFAAGLWAVIRFTGHNDPQARDEAEAQLSTWIESRGWKATGEPVLAVYDPPWTPSILRRTELLIPVDGVE